MGEALRRRLIDVARGRFRLRVHLCSHPGCRRFTVAHRFLRKDGVFLEGNWLCSVGCLEAAVAGALAGDEGRQVYTMPRLPRMPFRLLLLESGVLSEVGLADALQHAECTGLSLARALLSLELVTEAELAAARAAENGCAFYALPPAPVAAEAEVPGFLASRCQAATVHSASGRVLVGFVHRIDRELLRALEQMTSRKVEGCFVTASHREQQMALARSCGGGVLERAASAGDAARSVVRHAVRFGAEQLLSRRVGGVGWVRMSADTRTEDHFFQVSEEVSRLAPAKGLRKSMTDGKKLQEL